MRILFLSRLYSPHRGGVEKHVEKLSEQLIKRGHQVVVITEQYEQSLVEKEVVKGVMVYRVPYFAINSKTSMWTWMDKHIDIFDQADVVHVHDVFWWYWPIWVMRLMKPVYITYHGYEGVNPPTKKIVALRKASEIICRGSICVGEFMKKWYFASPNMITYGAADLKLLQPCKQQATSFLGRFEEDTGVLMYAEAVKMIKQLKAVNFYGSGSELEQLKSIAGTSKQIQIYDWTNKVESVLKTSRYVFVSRYLGILEAMQAGRLVFAVYNNQIKKDYLECHPMRDNMVIAGSAAELAHKFKEILKTPEKEEVMVARAYEWAEQQTWAKMMEGYLNLWQM